ncbi:hypothetical protein [Microbaculum marinisediminis]|uniref:Transposase n=1 Tax=Microbaculum marinisediminis TaxID=2931392 RepID=A0AAW5QWS4_9HYPH|nr:hypothetical protein [Microbaculum sp. A6E488]MCT8970745.1 hypothetical protein [Microbaculum sp. A6E488]
MTKAPDKSKPKDDRKDKLREEKKHLNDVLDEALEESFPASDAPAVVRPGHGIPTDRSRSGGD